MSNQSQRDHHYLEEIVATASPGRLLVLLYDRLMRDLVGAERALFEGDRDVARAALTHGGEIVAELLATLDGTHWVGARDLARIYAWLTGELIAAGIHAEAERVAGARELVEELRAAWREAADVADPAS